MQKIKEIIKRSLDNQPDLKVFRAGLRNDKRYLFTLAAVSILLILGIGGFFVWKGLDSRLRGNDNGGVSEAKDLDSSSKTQNDIVKFTHQIFDPARVDRIVPLGELNGGYIETQTVNGVMVQMKGEWQKPVEPMEIFAPTGMTLKYYSFMPAQGGETANYQMTFTINDDMEMTFHHITDVKQEFKEAMPQTSSSAGVTPHKQISLKAGELFAMTTGTAGHNWNIYLRDNKKTNTFVNQERYEKIKDGYSFVNAVCPFDYYEDSVKQLYYPLFGATKAGQSKTCGNPSKDVKGSISGLWYLSKEYDLRKMMMGEYQGLFATPFSIYKDSAGQIVIYEINRQRYILGAENPTYKDPASITGEHCYVLSKYPGERRNGYAYFKVINDTEMKMSYSASGSCPSQFLEANAINYYR